MAVPANTHTTFAAKNLKEDLSDVLENISPTERPFTKALGKPGKAKALYTEWVKTSLAPASDDNAVIEGADADADAANNGARIGNYCQLSDKVASVASTAEAVDGVGDLQTMAVQIAMKTEELALDIEKTVLSNKPAVPGVAGTTATRAASFISFLESNVSRGAGGANPTLSGGTMGYPNAAPTDGTQRAFVEDQVLSVMQSCWEKGGKPTHIFMGGTAKTKFSQFTGNATRYKDTTDSKVNASVDIYVTDFGELRAVPSRHMRARDAIILDPKKAQLLFLQKAKQEPLAKTGHSDKRMVSAQWTLKVHNEAAHGHIADLTP